MDDNGMIEDQDNGMIKDQDNDMLEGQENVMIEDQEEVASSSRHVTSGEATLGSPMDNNQDEDDPVIGEIPVFLSKREDNDNLYLFQYPVRPANMPYTRETVRAARIKPRQKRIELVMGVDHNCPNYDKSKGRQIVLNAQGQDPAEADRLFAGGLMDKQTLASTLAVDSTSRFAAGMLVRRKRKMEEEEEDEESPLELHLTPLHGITQLRPSYEYLDRADLLKSKKEADGNSTEEDEEEEAQQVTVRFARGAPRGGANRGGGAARNTSSWRKMQKKLEEEAWLTDIRWHEKMSKDELLKMLTNKSKSVKSEDIEMDLSKPPDDYLKTLQPTGLEDKEKVAPAMPSNVLSLSELKDLNASDALLALLTNAKVMGFSQILQLLPQTAAATASQAEILRQLQQIAVLIRGNWVVKSQLLYPEKSCSRHSGVAASLLCRGRDYMLWKFTQSRNVIRKDIQSTTKLPADDILEMLNGVAHMRHGHGWNFRLETDQDFVNKHADIVAKQNSFWDQKVKALVNQGLKINVHASASGPDLQLVKSRNRLNSEVSSSDDSDGGRRNSNSNSPRLPRSRKSSINRPSKSGPTSPATKSPQVARKDSISKSKSHQQWPLSNSIRSLQDFKKDGGDPPGEEEAMDISEITPRISNGVKPETHSNGEKSKSPTAKTETHSNGEKSKSPTAKTTCNPDFVQFVKEKLESEMTMKLSDFKRAFQFKLAESDPGSGLGKAGFNEKMVESAVKDSGGVRLKIAWPKNSDLPEEPVFACVKKGDDLDPMRSELLKIFCEMGRIQSKALRTRLEESWKNDRNPDDALSEEVFKQLKTEYCVSKSSNLYLRNTVTS